MPQPNLVPGRPATSRTAHSKGMLGSASSVVGLPLSSNEVDMVTPRMIRICRSLILQISRGTHDEISGVDRVDLRGHSGHLGAQLRRFQHLGFRSEPKQLDAGMAYRSD